MITANKHFGYLATNRSTIILGALLITLSGCSITPKPEPAKDIKQTAKLPNHWLALYEDSKTTPQFWLNDFSAPELPPLIQKALKYNHNLAITRSRMDAARARSVIARSSRSLTGNINADVSRTDSDSDSDSNYNIGTSVSWEADVWGRLSNEIRASELDAKAAQSDFYSARLSLAATVARSWFASVENQLQVDLSKRTLNSFTKSLETVEGRYKSGLSSALDVRLARTNVATAKSTLATRQRELDASIRALEILLGDYPAASLKVTRNLPRVKTRIPAGLPSQLLSRRPDLVAAELRLKSAGQDLESAKKNRLPSITLTGRTGTGSSELEDLLDWENLVKSILGGITQPIFQGKRLKTEEELARFQRDEVWSSYAQSVLTAFSEVETTLAADAYFATQEVALRQASKEAKLAVDLATDRYTSGLENITTLLESQRRMFNAESALLQTQLARLDSRVRLYLALGGDFQAKDKQATQGTSS